MRRRVPLQKTRGLVFVLAADAGDGGLALDIDELGRFGLFRAALGIGIVEVDRVRQEPGSQSA